MVSTTDEGRTTIEILGLNRAQLVALSRRGARPGEESSGTRRRPGWPPRAASTRWPSTASSTGGCRSRRSAASSSTRWAQGQRTEIDQALQASPEGPSSVAEVAGDLRVVTKAERKRVKGAFDKAQIAQDTYSLAGEANASEDYFRRTRRIERIEVRNFKVIGDLDLTPSSLASSTATAPWLMLLGENGCGKSSLLQAVALTLMGAPERDALGLDARTYVRNGTRSGHVRVHLAGSPEPIQLRFSRSSERFEGGAETKSDPPRLRRDTASPAPRRAGSAADVVARAGAEPVRPVLPHRQLDRLVALAGRRRPSTRSRGRSRASSRSRATTASSGTAGRAASTSRRSASASPSST